jgi:hypothetical protein
VIRQAISCDICANEKKQTNHWFVAYEYGGELRVSGWNSRNRLRPGSKHLCGQTCLHKLVDDFMARALQTRAPAAMPAELELEAEIPRRATATDTSLTLDSAFIEVESSARLLPSPKPAPPVVAPPSRPLPRPQPEVIAMPGRFQPEEPALQPDEPPRYASRNWRAEAWDREREREMRATGRRQEIAPRRRSGS